MAASGLHASAQSVLFWWMVSQIQVARDAIAAQFLLTRDPLWCSILHCLWSRMLHQSGSHKHLAHSLARRGLASCHRLHCATACTKRAPCLSEVLLCSRRVQTLIGAPFRECSVQVACHAWLGAVGRVHPAPIRSSIRQHPASRTASLRRLLQCHSHMCTWQSALEYSRAGSLYTMSSVLSGARARAPA